MLEGKNNALSELPTLQNLLKEVGEL